MGIVFVNTGAPAVIVAAVLNIPGVGQIQHGFGTIEVHKGSCLIQKDSISHKIPFPVG